MLSFTFKLPTHLHFLSHEDWDIPCFSKLIYQLIKPAPTSPISLLCLDRSQGLARFWDKSPPAKRMCLGKSCLSFILWFWTSHFLCVSSSHTQYKDKEISQRLPGDHSWYNELSQNFPSGLYNQGVPSPRKMILQSHFPGTTDGCGNRIHRQRLYVANIPRLSKCSNKQSTSWWHRNYKAKTIIITHVCFCSSRTRDVSIAQTQRRKRYKSSSCCHIYFTSF